MTFRTVVSNKPSFAGGEIAEELWGRLDFQRYDIGLARLKNLIVLPGGGLTRTPPTEHVAEAYDSSVLHPFEFGRSDAYAIEIGVDGGNEKLRFFRDGGILSDGGPVEVVTPWAAADLDKIRSRSSADVVYLAHGDYTFRQLSRIDNVTWTLGDAELDHGPFLSPNTDQAKTISASAATGAGITLTATGFTFTDDQVGQFIRFDEIDKSNIKHFVADGTNITTGTLFRSDQKVYKVVSPPVTGPIGFGAPPPTFTEGFGTGNTTGALSNVPARYEFERFEYGIVEVKTVAVDGVTATADVIEKLPEDAVSANASYKWSEGVFSERDGYPDTIGFYQQRMVLARSNIISLSKSVDFLNHLSTGDPQDGVLLRLGSDTQRVNDINWISGRKVLAVGTEGEEFSLSASSITEGLTATNIEIDPETTEGSKQIDAVRISAAVIHPSRDGRRLHEFIYDFQIDSFRSNDLTAAALHITAPQIKKHVWQRDPHRVIWVLLTDGSLVAVTYFKEHEVLAWHRHDVGGTIDDILVTPSADGSYDELWLLVNRTVEGGTVRCVERMLRYFDPEIDTVPGAIPYLNGQVHYTGPAITQLTTGIEHFAGQVVTIVSGGGVKGTATVSGAGVLDLPKSLDDFYVGQPARAHARLLPSAEELPDGISEGRVRNVVGLNIRFRGGPGALIGRLSDVDAEPDDDFEYLAAWDADKMDTPPKMISEVKEVAFDDDWSAEDFVDIIQDEPFALQILSAPRVLDFGGM